MHAILRGGLVSCLLSAGVSMAAPTTINIAASKDLKLAIVDGSKASPQRDATHAAFASSLGQALSRLGAGGDVGVRVKCVNADHAAFNLGTGVYDAVLVLSGTLPRALMISDVSRLNATLGSGKAEKKVYLVFGNGDETLGKLLSSSFALALSNNKFLDALDGVGPALLAGTGGEKIVTATP